MDWQTVWSYVAVGKGMGMLIVLAVFFVGLIAGTVSISRMKKRR